MSRGAREVRQVRTLGGGVERRTPVVTYALIAINLLIFGITVAAAGSVVSNQRSTLFVNTALVPAAVADGELWRLLTSGFLHFGPIHIAVNMLALWLVGRDVEMVLGRARFLGVYFTSLLGGAAAVMMFSGPLTFTAGASGAIFGLFGAQAIILLRVRQSPGPVITVIALNVFISVTLPGISLMGHLGGLFAGIAASAGILFGPQWLGSDSRPGGTARAIQWGLVLAIVVACASMIIVRILVLRSQFGF